MNNPLLEELLKQVSNENRAETLALDARKRAFNFQIECLKMEIDLVDRVMSRSSTATQSVKNFGIAAWGASTTLFLSQVDLRAYTIMTAVIPLLFWFIDAWWASRSRSARLRLRKISEFLNSEKLTESFRTYKLIDFSILDVRGKQYKGTSEYTKTSSFNNILWYKEIAFLYGTLLFFNLVLGVIMLLR